MLLSPNSPKKGFFEEKECYCSTFSRKDLLPLGEIYSESKNNSFSVHYFCKEGDSLNVDWINSVGPKSVEELCQWVEDGHREYLENIIPESLLDRMSDAYVDRR